jgi:flagellar L-ring protein precursor FlgH
LIRILAVLIVLLAGCTRPYLEEPPWPAPTPLNRASQPREEAPQSTSLWSNEAPLTHIYSDHRARAVGDLVTVLVIETSEASREASTGVSRDTSVAANVQSFLGSPGPYVDPNVAATTSNSFKGAGTTKRKDVLRSSVSARVVDVLADGNLVLEGRRQVKVSEDTQYLFVRGIARPEDISKNNTISSVALADAQILYGGRGLLANQQRPGWMYRILDVVWPF